MLNEPRLMLGAECPPALAPGPKAFGGFLVFGATMSCFAGTTLLWRGTILDRIWKLNPKAYRQLTPMGPLVGVAFLILSASMVLAAIGWFQRRRWGWRLAIAIISTQLVGDSVNLIRGEWLRGGTGFLFAGALLWYLLRPGTRSIFAIDARLRI
jgi:hypothetical protein